MMSTPNRGQEKVRMCDIRGLPIYRVTVNAFGKVPCKEKVREIVDNFSSVSNYQVDNDVRNSQKLSLLWLNDHCEEVESFLQTYYNCVDENRYNPVILDSDREVTTTNVQQRIMNQMSFGNNVIQNAGLVNVEIDKDFLYKLLFSEGRLPEDNGLLYGED